MTSATDSDFDAATWLLALNPVSGGGKGLAARARIERRLALLGQRSHTVVSDYAGATADQVATAVRRGCRRVLVVGGDGSLSEAINGLFAQNAVPPSEVTVALLPMGTGNDWARSHGVPTALTAAIELAVTGQSRRHDVGLVAFEDGRRRHFVNVAGAGFDALAR